MLAFQRPVCQSRGRPGLRGELRPLARIALVAVAAAAMALPGWLHAQVISGTVRQIISMRPIPGVSVSLLNGSDSTLRTTSTSRVGTFRFTDLAPGQYSLAVRAIGFEPLTTTAMKITESDTVVLEVNVMPVTTTLDTMKITTSKPLFGVTPGRTQFLEHYRNGSGLFLSGAEIEASKKGIAAYVAGLPGFTDFAGGRPSTGNPSACEGLNAELYGEAPSLHTGRTPGSTMGRPSRGNFCALLDEMGRSVGPIDAPCVVSRVDRIGFVSRVLGTDLIVHRQEHLYRPQGTSILSEAQPTSNEEIVIHLSEIIGVEFYRAPQEIPPGLRIRGATIEAEVMTSRCGLIQFWTRTAW